MAAAKKDIAPPAIGAGAAEPDLVLVEAVEPIRHNGKDVAPGSRFDVTAETAAALVAAGAAISATPEESAI